MSLVPIFAALGKVIARWRSAKKSTTDCHNCKHDKSYHVSEGCIAKLWTTTSEIYYDRTRHVRLPKCKCREFIP
jgi:hypothetical protein